ncbi:unnamed protein product [Mycena citricolor]|uniref:Uncharacterized protein n=1 Tax=Mycena citricolor TaxID=2018698 RepID=A0AAD2H822_9AGAR|nr:unnamed protein product [Mycena citricolor]
MTRPGETTALHPRAVAGSAADRDAACMSSLGVGCGPTGSGRRARADATADTRASPGPKGGARVVRP